MKFFTACCVLLLTIGSFSPARAESEPRLLNDWHPASGRHLGRFFAILPRADALEADEILAGGLDPRFQTNDKDQPSFGFRADTFWLRLATENTTTSQLQRTLEFANPSVDAVTVFVLNENRNLLKTISLGDDRPFELGRDIAYRTPSFELELPPGARRLVYLRVRTTGTMNLFLRLWERDELKDHRQQEYIFYALFYGIMLAMVLYNFFLYLGVRGSFGFLYYVAFILTFVLTQLSTNGMGFQYFWPELPALNQVSVPGSVYCCAVAFLLFSRKFLVLKEIAPRWDRLSIVLIFAAPALLLITFSAFFVFDWRRYVLPANLFALVVALFAIVGGVLASRAGIRQARFFLVAWGGLIGGVLLVIGRNLGFVPDHGIVQWGLELGSTWLVLLLSLGLADIINRMRQELEQYSRTLETRVEKRTLNLKNSLDRVKDLKDRQDGDYFLMSLLMKPLGLNRAGQGPVRIDTLLDQYKKFHFRKWKSQIGGDLCVSDEIILRDKPYTVFLNADAMGKSMQGAGGYLVLGSVFASILERTRRSEFDRRMYPERWLQNSFLDMNQVFESFNGSMMASATLGLVEHSTGALFMVNAEHPLPVLYREGQARFVECDEVLRRLGSTFEHRGLTVTHMRLRPGDVLFAGSDGRDDLRLPRPGKPINANERLFLEHVEAGQGDLARVYEQLLNTGELTDDISLMRLEYVGADTAIPANAENTKTIRDARRRIKQLYENQDYPAAAMLCLDSAEQYPEEEYFIYSASVCLRRMGRFSEAVDEAERLILRAPEKPHYVANLARIYSRIDPERSRQYARQYQAMKTNGAAVLAGG